MSLNESGGKCCGASGPRTLGSSPPALATFTTEELEVLATRAAVDRAHRRGI